jgi:hypothetical protein
MDTLQSRITDQRIEGRTLVNLLTVATSVAIVGASMKVGSYSHRAMTYLRDYGYSGSLYLINPTRDETSRTAPSNWLSWPLQRSMSWPLSRVLLKPVPVPQS